MADTLPSLKLNVPEKQQGLSVAEKELILGLLGIRKKWLQLQLMNISCMQKDLLTFHSENIRQYTAAVNQIENIEGKLQ